MSMAAAEVPARAVVTRLLSPEKWIDRQIGNLKAVGEANYGVGISFPKKDPIAEGIAAEARYAEEVKKAIGEERRKKALEATNIDEWFGYAKDIGKPRLVEGVTKREKEVKDFVGPWQPILLDHVAKMDALPKVTLKERIDKAVANIEGLVALKGKWRGT